MGANLREAQTNLENEAIKKRDGKFGCLLLIVCDDK